LPGERKRSTWWFAALILATACGALAFRLPHLDRRPLHGDEANQAHKAGVLLDTGLYRYDPQEHHGPTLYYLTLPVAWLSGAKAFADTNEWTYRVVPIVFGVGLVLLLLLVADGPGRTGTFCAAVLTAVSPAMVFYSRYYIQEMLLVFFTFAAIACAWRYTRKPRMGWAIGTGIALGLMHATKETCIIAYASMAAGVGAVVFGPGRVGENQRSYGVKRAIQRLRTTLSWPHVAAGALAGAAASTLFFSSFFGHPRGVLDSILTFGNYFTKAEGAGIHDQPWYFYLKMLAYAKPGPGPWWSEGLILGLFVVGAVSAFGRPFGSGSQRAFARFLVVYTVAMTVLYAAIPYKTPWCMLGFLHGMILVAGIGATMLLRWSRRPPVRMVVAALLLAATVQLACQAHRATGRYAADWRNPYVYAHTSPAFLRLPERAEQIARVAPEGHAMRIDVIVPNRDYWPLPWYLRRFAQVGYWDEIPETLDAPLIIASPDLETELTARLQEDYEREFHGLRPGVLLHVYIRRDLWDAFLDNQDAPGN